MTPVLFASLSLLLLSGLHQQAECSTAKEREAVVRELLKKSHRLVRPDGAGGRDTPVRVNISLSLLRILDVDELNGHMEGVAFLLFTWSDPRLSFSPSTNVTSVRLDPSLIWTPDVELFNNKSPLMRNLASSNLVLVQSSGLIMWVPQISFFGLCEQAPGYFQTAMNCTLRFGSWTYNGDDFDLRGPPAVDMSWYQPTGRWRINSSSVSRHVNRFSCCPEPYVTVEFTFHLVRN
ncbi:acetylcholine receptor subunit alpha-type acr-16-like [Babylonia areolata]|uniref:acetylcholine receptor subunit alpha-type acr-16-like n=1 Tax=Babylonia areolata TaxID=304850 RepID=UPI003FD0B971